MSSDLCRPADGAHAPIRIDVECVGGSRRQYELVQPFLLIGNHERSDVVLNSAEVSRRQLFVQLLGGRIFATHLSPRVPTLWNGVSQPSGWIDGNTVLSIGPYVVRFPDAGRPEELGPVPNTSPLAVGSCVGPPIQIEMKNARAGANVAIIKRAVTFVGNDPVCKLRLNSSRVSSVHCCLVRTSPKLMIIDLASTEGVVVNGITVKTAQLDHGDQVTLGSRVLLVRYEKSGVIVPPTGPGETASGIDFSPTEFTVAPTEPNPSASRAKAAVVPPNHGVPVEPTAIELATLHSQTVEQFQEMMEMMMRAFSGAFMEHCGSVRGELDRLNQLVRELSEQRQTGPVNAAQGGPTKLPRPSGPAPDLTVPLPPLGRLPSGEDVHSWIQQRLGTMDEKKASWWERMSARLRSKSAEGEGS